MHIQSNVQIKKWKKWCKNSVFFFFFLLLLNAISPKWKPVCQSCPAPNERHMHIYERSHTRTHTHSETNNEENKVFLSVGGSVGYTRWDRAKLRLAFPLGARCWICIWIQLWGARFMPLWTLPSRVFFFSLSAPFSLSSCRTVLSFSHCSHFPHTSCELLFTVAKLFPFNKSNKRNKNSYLLFWPDLVYLLSIYLCTYRYLLLYIHIL